MITNYVRTHKKIKKKSYKRLMSNKTKKIKNKCVNKLKIKVNKMDSINWFGQILH